jgi:hypothetical protein
VTSFFGRRLRLELVAGLGLALAFSAAHAQSLATTTTLSADTRDVNGRTQATLSVAVADENGQPVSGAVIVKDNGRQIAGVALSADGAATSVVTLAPGSHALTATYAGSSAYSASVSSATPVAAATSTTPDFTVTVSPGTLSLTQGQSGTTTVSVTPVNASSLTAPMFVTVSCSGLPDQSTCTFTPSSVEILPNATSASTSSMLLTTVAGSAANTTAPHPFRTASPITWALLLPGLGLAGLAFGARRRAWLSRLSLLGLLAVVTVLGTTGCNPLYNYKNHGPTANRPTPTGTYNITIAAQSSNGVTATTHTTTLALTVK